MLPSNLIRLNGTQALVADRQYFFDAAFNRATLVDLMGIYVSTGGGTAANKMHIGLYEVDPNTGDAGYLIFEVTGLDPSVAGWVSGSVTEQIVQAGCYYLSVWCDVAVTIKGNDTSIRSPTIFKASTSGASAGHDYTSGLSSLTGLPSPATITTNNASGRLIAMAIGHS